MLAFKRRMPHSTCPRYWGDIFYWSLSLPLTTVRLFFKWIATCNNLLHLDVTITIKATSKIAFKEGVRTPRRLREQLLAALMLTPKLLNEHVWLHVLIWEPNLYGCECAKVPWICTAIIGTVERGINERTWQFERYETDMTGYSWNYVEGVELEEFRLEQLVFMVRWIGLW
jgi:hypothetical protein